MKKFLFSLLIASMVLSMTSVLPAAAQEVDEGGKVVKLEDSSTLYYITADGERYVFPNEKTYKSWFTDFSDVEVITAEELADYPLTGNIRYRPGVLLVKIQTDPKVYAVSKNGVIRWVKTEGIAKNLYGDFWSQLVDDVPAGFFVNYSIGDDIDDDNDFDPQDEVEENDSIEKNRGKLISFIRKAKKATSRFCADSERRICQFIDRLTNDDDSDDDEDEDDRGKKVRVCHMPPGNPDNKETISVGLPAVRAHLAHGDTIGRCDRDDDDDDDDDDTTELMIDNVDSSNSTSTATITWSTNIAATSKVTYATDSIDSASSTEMVSSSATTTAHSIDLTGLTPSTTYYFIVESTDDDGNTATSSEQMFTTDDIEEPVDETPPVISSITATPTSTTAVITWLTDEASSSKVTYATSTLDTASSTEMESDSALVTSHELTLTGLTASTTYYFIVESTDADDNTATSTESTFSID